MSAAETFDVTDELNWEEVHRSLQEVLELLKDVINSHPRLNSTDILHLTANIIADVKGLSLLFQKFFYLILRYYYFMHSHLVHISSLSCRVITYVHCLKLTFVR